jgi:hypothetical protein
MAGRYMSVDRGGKADRSASRNSIRVLFMIDPDLRYFAFRRIVPPIDDRVVGIAESVGNFKPNGPIGFVW